MNGWERLAVVIVAPISLICGAIEYGDSYEYDYHEITDESLASLIIDPFNEEGVETNGQSAFWDAYWVRGGWSGRLDGCEQGTVKARLHALVQPYSVSLECTRSQTARLKSALGYAAIPAFLMWLLVMTFHWVYAGFRPKRT